jgi:hypothetical protein
MEASRLLMLRNHLLRQSDSRQAFPVSEGFRLADKELKMRISAKVRSALAASAHRDQHRTAC